MREAVSGGVKKTFDPKGSLAHENCEKDVYANVPFQRTEYTAGSIRIYFNLDVAGIRALGLPQEAQELLTCLALYKVRRILDGGLRLRTACDLRLKGDIKVTGMEALPSRRNFLKSFVPASRPANLTSLNPLSPGLPTKLVRNKKKTENEDDED